MHSAARSAGCMPRKACRLSVWETCPVSGLNRLLTDVPQLNELCTPSAKHRGFIAFSGSLIVVRRNRHSLPPIHPTIPECLNSKGQHANLHASCAQRPGQAASW